SAANRPIYPPVPTQRVRREFIERVRTRWRSLGEQWFMEHNHHGDATRFDASSGEFVTDWTHRALAFDVIYADDSLQALPPISHHVFVTCAGLARAATASCHESPRSEWERLFPGVQGTELLRRAAAQPRLVNSR